MTGQTFAAPDELVGRLLESALGAMDLFALFVGEQAGYYRALAEKGALTSTQLAQATGTHERYAREWLEQQATSGLLAFSEGDAATRSYSLPEGYASVLVDSLSDLFVAPLGRFAAAVFGRGPELLNAYRTGGGVSWSEFGDLARTAQADFNRPFFLNGLVEGYLSQVLGLDAALKASGARVAEIGPGGGWAMIALAKAYPSATVDGFDIDGPSVELANANIAAAGLSDRARAQERDAGDGSIDGQYDLVAAYECVHDMPDPVSVLSTMRRLAKPGAPVIIMDERVGETFGNVGDFNERLFYGFSIGMCLPDGMSHQPSVGTGTVMRPDTLRAYAQAAGFADIEILPLEHDLFRFYRLVA